MVQWAAHQSIRNRQIYLIDFQLHNQVIRFKFYCEILIYWGRLISAAHCTYINVVWLSVQAFRIRPIKKYNLRPSFSHFVCNETTHPISTIFYDYVWLIPF